MPSLWLFFIKLAGNFVWKNKKSILDIMKSMFYGASRLFRRGSFLLALVSLPLGVDAASTCVVGGTDFTTAGSLCNPSFSDDTLGWFSPDLGDLLGEACSSAMSDVTTNITHVGMSSNVCTSASAGVEFDEICELATTNSLSSNYAGMSKVVGNARVVSPYFTDTKSGNLFVNSGTGQGVAFLTYSLSGLEPGSTATLTCDVYSLLDPANLEYAMLAMNEGVKKSTDLVANLKIGSLTFGMQSSGSTLTEGSGRINGNGLSLTICDGGVSNNQAAGNTVKVSPGFGENTTATLEGTVDSEGNITFYFVRSGGAEFAPVGIDNIEVTGSISPQIYSQKKLPVCPGQPVLLGLKQTYPSGTTYNWSWNGGSETSTSATFTVEPPAAEQTYSVSCTVSLPTGCKATATMDLTTKTCCSTSDGVPLAETFVVYEDFGSFSSDKTTYSHTDEAGNTTTISTQGGMYSATDLSRPYVTYVQDGVTTGIPAATGNSSSPNDVWMITCANPYTPGITGDASGTATGGMFIFDLSGETCGGKSIENMVVYERTITGLCKGKEISFSALFGAINNNTSGVGEMKIVLRKGSSTGEIIYDSKKAGQSGMLYGNEGWQEAAYSFTLDDDITTVVFQVVNVTASYGNSQGDMAVDNISFSVCTPPDIAVDAELEGGTDLLDLCTDEVLRLKAQISSTAANYYGDNIGYLFQYTYQDPTVTDADDVTWYDLGSIQNTGTFEINSPAEHEAFAKIQDGDVETVYFRVVIGEATYLANSRDEWEKMNALSACRAISISSIPIEAGLNCPTCTDPKNIIISAASITTGAKIKKETTGVKYPTYYLCEGEGLVFSSNDLAPDHADWATDKFTGITTEWFIDGVSQGAKTGTNTSSVADDITMTNSSAGATSVTHVLVLHAFDNDYPTGTCQKADTINVVYLGNPWVVTGIDLDPYCYLAPLATTKKPTDAAGDVTIYSDNLKTDVISNEGETFDFAALEPGTYNYFWNVTTKQGCESELAEFNITVNPLPSYSYPEIDPFCAGQTTEVLKQTVTDESANRYTLDWTLGGAAAATDLSKYAGSVTPYDLSYVVIDANGCEAEPQTLSLTVKPATTVTVEATPACGQTAIVVSATPATSTQTWYFDDVLSVAKTTLVAADGDRDCSLKVVTNAEGYCADSMTIEVEVWSVPEDPTAIEGGVTYIKAQQVASPKDIMTQSSNAAVTYAAADDLELVWYTSETATAGSTEAPVPTVINVDDPDTQVEHYWVAVRNKTTLCESKRVEVIANLYGAPVPDVTSMNYCASAISNSNPTVEPISARATVNQAVAGVTYTLEFYADEAGTTVLDPTTVPDVTTPGKQTFWVSQISADGAKSNPVSFAITTYGVDKPKVDQTAYEYCKGVTATALTATLNADDAAYTKSQAVQWSTDGTTYADAAPMVSTAEVGSSSYFVRQYYAVLNNVAGVSTTTDVCIGEPVEITVDVTETTAPEGEMQVTYVLADAEATGSFANLLDQNSAAVTVDAGYDYYFAPCDASGVATDAWGAKNVVPSPAVPSKAELDGASKTVYYLVKRVSQTSPYCESESVIITVTISDSPMPICTPQYYCEGDAIDALTSFVAINTMKKTADKYELHWYETMPTSTTDLGSTTAPAAPAAEIDATQPNKPKTYTYYVAQKDLETDALGSPSTLTLTVYPKPVLSITDPAAVCSKQVDLASTVTVSNQISGVSYAFSYSIDVNATQQLASSAVAESGTYYISSAFVVPNTTDKACYSTVDPVNVTIDVLNFTKPEDVQTCPNSVANLTAVATANTEVTFAWSGTGDTGAGTTTDDAATGTYTNKFATTQLLGVTNDRFLYNVTATAGSCSSSFSGVVVTLGDGPIVGTLTLNQENNAEGTVVYTDRRDASADPYYICSDAFTATADFTKDAGSEYSWTKDGVAVSGSSLSGAGTYVISFSNECPTTVTFVVKDASIRNNKLTVSTTTTLGADGETLEICELDPFTMTLSYDCSEANTLVWDLDGGEAVRANGKSISITSAKKSTDNGTYTYTITSHGCTVSGDTTLKVKEYIKFSPDQNGEYIVKRDSTVTLKNIITVPDGTLPGTITWTENAVAVSAAEGMANYTIQGLDSDHNFIINMEDEDYCPASGKITVKMDGLLQLNVTVEDSMCRGDKGVYLVIDTTGTGKLIYPMQYSLTVVETTETGSKTLSGWSKTDDVLKLEINPTSNATYSVTAAYRQSAENTADRQIVADNSASIVVLQPIEIKVPTGLQTCSGEAIEVALSSVSPDGVVVDWTNDGTITSGYENTSLITVEPEYNSEARTSHYSINYYVFNAKLTGCHDKVDSVAVRVYEPLSGDLADEVEVCEGERIRVDAGSYGAMTYEWTTARIGNPVSTTQVLNVLGEQTEYYTVKMTRENCTKTDSVKVIVNSNPVILSVDSLDYHKVEIVADFSYGGETLYYSVDNGTSDVDSQKDSITYGNHTAYIIDNKGCSTSLAFKLNAPPVEIPTYFSPNGDGEHDVWTVPTISETYPTAEITIYDRYGKKLVEFLGADAGWDGTYNGNPMPTTDYWYEIHVREIDKIYTGHFTLLRR